MYEYENYLRKMPWNCAWILWQPIVFCDWMGEMWTGCVFKNLMWHSDSASVLFEAAKVMSRDLYCCWTVCRCWQSSRICSLNPFTTTHKSISTWQIVSGGKVYLSHVLSTLHTEITFGTTKLRLRLPSDWLLAVWSRFFNDTGMWVAERRTADGS